jgi:hypothetical protein
VVVAELALKGLFSSAAKDPRLIPGVHRYCDEWCARCSVTERCLAFRGMAIYRKARNRLPTEPTFRATAEAIEFTQEIAAAEGAKTPELDQVAGGGRLPALQARDVLIAHAWEYALGVSLWLVFTPEELQRFAQRPLPPPEEVVLWHHLRIYLKLVRALIAAERVRAGATDAGEDANGCAKLTLVSVQKSRQALLQIRRRSSPDQAGSLLALLDSIERSIDQRFPRARAFIRVGIDVPAA